jgi:hypothetical protein
MVAIAARTHADVEPPGAWIIGASAKVIREANGAAFLVAIMHAQQLAWHCGSFALAFALALALVAGGSLVAGLLLRSP